MPHFKIGPAFLKEHRLKNLREVASSLNEIDMDEGIRVVGKIESLKGGGFIFIGRTQNGFAINTCDRLFDRKNGLYIAKGIGEIFEASSVEDVISFLKNNAKKPLDAVRY